VFPIDNSILIQNEMNETDKRVDLTHYLYVRIRSILTLFQIFNFDVTNLDWSEYWLQYCIGTKKYLLHEDFNHMPKCRKRNQRYFFLILILRLNLEFYLQIKTFTKPSLVHSRWSHCEISFLSFN